MTQRIIPQVLTKDTPFGQAVHAHVPESQIISLVDSVEYIAGQGASPVAVLTGDSIVPDDQKTPEVVEDLKNFVALRQGSDCLFTTKEQLEVILKTLG